MSCGTDHADWSAAFIHHHHRDGRRRWQPSGGLRSADSAVPPETSTTLVVHLVADRRHSARRFPAPPTAIRNRSTFPGMAAHHRCCLLVVGSADSRWRITHAAPAQRVLAGAAVCDMGRCAAGEPRPGALSSWSRASTYSVMMSPTVQDREGKIVVTHELPPFWACGGEEKRLDLPDEVCETKCRGGPAQQKQRISPCFAEPFGHEYAYVLYAVHSRTGPPHCAFAVSTPCAGSHTRLVSPILPSNKRAWKTRRIRRSAGQMAPWHRVCLIALWRTQIPLSARVPAMKTLSETLGRLTLHLFPEAAARNGGRPDDAQSHFVGGGRPRVRGGPAADGPRLQRRPSNR